MDIETLQTFIDVVRRNSFAAVARKRYQDPSVFSRRIAALERECGMRLFDRNTRRLVLTASGRQVFERLSGPVAAIDQAFDAGRDELQEPSGDLRMPMSTSMGERWFMPRLAEFRSRFPQVQLDLLLSDQRVDLISAQIDLAIRLGQRVEGAYAATRLMETRYHIVAAPELAARFADGKALNDVEAVVFPLPGYHSTWRLRDGDGRIEEHEINPTLTISSALGIRRAVMDGMGVGLLANWMVDDDMTDGTLVDLFPSHTASAADFDTSAWLVFPTIDYVPARTRAMIDHLKASVM